VNEQETTLEFAVKHPDGSVVSRTSWNALRALSQLPGVVAVWRHEGETEWREHDLERDYKQRWMTGMESAESAARRG
jgi:hypothetical protein